MHGVERDAGGLSPQRSLALARTAPAGWDPPGRWNAGLTRVFIGTSSMAPNFRPIRGYGLAVALSAVALALAGLTVRAFGGAYLHFPLIAVFVSALYGGLGPGMLAVALSWLGFDLIYMGPRLRLGVETADEAHRLVAFVIAGAAATWIAARFRSARHDAEEARRAAEAVREEALRVGALQERLVAVVGHDLRNPLAAVKGNLDLLARLGPLGERQADVVRRMSRTVARMDGLICDLLDLARTRQGRPVELSPAEVRLGEVCARAVAEIRDANPDADIALVVEGDDRAVVDPARIAQAASNLVANALQHGRPGAPVRVRVAASGGEIGLEVENDGEPIPAELAPHLFEPFRRGHDTPGGLGLGLFVVREIARAHGGSVECRSAGGRTVFRVRMPRTGRGGTEGGLGAA